MTASFKNYWQDYRSSFRSLYSKNALLIAFIDAAFYGFALFFATIIGGVSRQWSSSITATVNGLTLGDLATQTATRWPAVKLITLIISFLLFFFLVLLAAWLISRGFIWARVSGRRYSWNFGWRFAMTNLVLLIILAIPFSYLLYGLYQSVQYGPTPQTTRYYYYHLIFLVIVFYISYLMNSLFTRHERVFATLKDTARQAVMAFPRIIVPFVFMILTIGIGGIVSQLFTYLPEPLSTLLGGVMFFVFFTWMKVYYYHAASVFLFSPSSRVGKAKKGKGVGIREEEIKKQKNA